MKSEKLQKKSGLSEMKIIIIYNYRRNRTKPKKPYPSIL